MRTRKCKGYLVFLQEQHEPFELHVSSIEYTLDLGLRCRSFSRAHGWPLSVPIWMSFGFTEQRRFCIPSLSAALVVICHRCADELTRTLIDESNLVSLRSHQQREDDMELPSLTRCACYRRPSADAATARMGHPIQIDCRGVFRELRVQITRNEQALPRCASHGTPRAWHTDSQT